MLKKTFFLAVLLFIVSLQAWAQKKVESPRKSAEGKIGEASISINYGSPSVKGRKIWGKLVKYKKVWRTGANECTVFKTDKDLMIEGKKLPAGEYGFFTIPSEKGKWILIFNSDSKQWGAYDYKDKKDVLRVEVDPQNMDSLTEALTFEVNAAGSVHWLWEKVKVSFKVQAL